MNPGKAKEILSLFRTEGETASAEDLEEALQMGEQGLDLMEKVTTLYNTSTSDLQLLRCFCESCFGEQWHIITTSGRLECLGCRAR